MIKLLLSNKVRQTRGRWKKWVYKGLCYISKIIVGASLVTLGITLLKNLIKAVIIFLVLRVLLTRTLVLIRLEKIQLFSEKAMMRLLRGRILRSILRFQEQ